MDTGGMYMSLRWGCSCCDWIPINLNIYYECTNIQISSLAQPFIKEMDPETILLDGPMALFECKPDAENFNSMSSKTG